MAWRTVVLVAFVVVTAPALSAQLPFTPRPERDAYRDLFSRNGVAQRPASPRERRQSPETSFQQEATDGLRPLESLPPEQQARAVTRTPVVICGTKIIPADPSVDPHIRVEPPDDDVEHTMRTITPPICRAR